MNEKKINKQMETEKVRTDKTRFWLEGIFFPPQSSIRISKIVALRIKACVGGEGSFLSLANKMKNDKQNVNPKFRDKLA